MKLQFRSKFYEAPNLEWDVEEGAVGGTYRGKPWKLHHLKEQHRRQQSKSEFTYRGVSYTKN